MDDSRWRRVTALFEELLAGADPDHLLASEPDVEIRTAAVDLWRHHMRAEQEDYLDAPASFQVAPVFEPGAVLLGRFRVEKPLGSGGMGEVYLAWDQRMECRVALKTIARLLATTESIRRRFIAEVQSARRVTHPNVCRIHELFEDGDTVFFSMEYLDGVLLSSMVGTEFAERHARAILRQMAQGLGSAHSTGVVHGDFKPANVMIVGSEEAVPRAVIMDFGLARAMDRAAAATDHRLSLRAGTIDYMAPELQCGWPPTIRSDIFAFGKVARALLPKEERLWGPCTHSDPEHRPASLDHVIRRLESGRSRRYWITSLALAFAGAAGYVLRTPGEGTPAIPRYARMLVNGFRARSGPPGAARLTRSVFLTAVQQSPVIHAISDQDLLPIIRRLQPQGMLPVDGRVLKSVMRQLRAAFWIDGELRQYGGRYSLTLRVLSGDRAIAERELRDLPNVIALAQAAATWVRAAAGESKRSLSANSVDVASYTTEVPEALQCYYDALEHYDVGEMDQAVPLLRQAVQLDPRFAQAHNLLALTIDSSNQFAEGFAEMETAMRLAPALPEPERLPIETNYYRETQDSARMIEAANRNLAYHPDEPRAHVTRAETLSHSGRVADALPDYRRAIELAPSDWIPVLLLQYALVRCGQYSQAVDELNAAQSRGIDNKWIYRGAGCGYLGLERYADAIAAFENEPFDFDRVADIQGPRVMQGHLAAAIAAMQEQRAAAGNPIEAHAANEFLCSLYLVADRPQSALPHVREMLDLPPYPPMSISFDATAFWAARLGDDETLARARELAAGIAQRWPNAHTRAVEQHARGLEAWRRRALGEAQELLVQSSGLSLNVRTLFDAADFFTATGQWDAAEAYWQKFEANRGWIIVDPSSPAIFVLAWLGRAMAAQGRNDRNAAYRYSRKVLDHWSHLNPGLRIVQAARNINLASKPL